MSASIVGKPRKLLPHSHFPVSEEQLIKEFIPTKETISWDMCIQEFVLNGLFREFKITFNEDSDVMAFNSPVYLCVKLHFATMCNLSLDKKPQWLVKAWSWHKKSGARLLLNRICNKRSNALHQIKNSMRGMMIGIED